MSYNDYLKFKKILHDFGGFDPIDVYNHVKGPAFDFRVEKQSRLKRFQKEHGSAIELLEKNKKDADEYFPFMRLFEYYTNYEGIRLMR